MARDPGGGASIRRKKAPVRPDDRPGPRQTSATKALDARAKKLDRLAREIGAGRVPAKRGAQVLRSLRLNDEERRVLGELTGKYSAEVQDKVGDRLMRGTAEVLGTALTAPFTGQRASTTARVLRENLTERGENVASRQPLGEPEIGMAAWVPGGPGKIPGGSGAKRWNNKRLQEIADEAAGGLADEVSEGAAKITGSLDEAKRLRLRQEKLYRAERGSRAGRSEAAAAKAGGGQAGYKASLKELRGELPKLKFGALDGEFDQPMVDKLFTHIQRGSLRPYEKLNAQRALTNVLEGRVPTRGDIRLLRKVFGDDAARQIEESIPFWAKAKNAGLQIINVPRALKASFDLSAPFRQGLVLGARHPRTFAKEFGPMLRSFASEGAYRNVMDDIASRPTFAVMQKAKLALTDLEGLATREEQFMSNLAEHIPIAGRGVRASGRAYTAFLNKFRADAFDNYLELAESQGLDITDEKLLRNIARWVNAATGRGNLGRFESSAVELNALLFSPRLIASRLNLLNPAYYAQLDPFTRRQALRGMGQLLGAVSLTLWTAKMAGASVGMDPRSANFGKIRIGDTRIDVMGGFQQYLVAASRLVSGETVNSSSGEVVRLEGGFAKPSRADILQRFGEQKMAPVPAFLNAWAKNENFEGDPFDPKKETGRLFVPLGFESAADTYGQTGSVPATAGGFGLNAIGFGVQTYGAPPAKKPAGGGRSRRGGSSSLRRRGGSGSKSLRRR